MHEHSEYCRMYGCNYCANPEEAEARYFAYWEAEAKRAYEDAYYFDPIED